MRIAFVTDTYEDGVAGGVVTARRFVKALRERHSVTVVASGPPAPGKVRVPGFQLPLRAMRENRFTFAWPSRAVLTTVFRNVDLVHVNFPFLLGVRAVRLARAMRKPVVAAFHVQPENLLLNIGIRWPRLARWMYRSWVKGFFQLADVVVCPSTFAAERLRVMGLTVPTWVVSNGISGRYREAVPRQAPLPGGRVALLAVGRLASEKRQDVIIDAVARCRQRSRIRLVIAGAGPLEGALRQRAHRWGLPVEFGYVSDDRLNQLYREAHIFVHASEVELEGMAVLEAMSTGLPVLVADAVDSAARHFASGPDFLFRAGDPDDLAARLDHLLENPELLVYGSRHSLELSAQHDFRRSVYRLEYIYGAVVQRYGPQPCAAVPGSVVETRSAP